MKNRILLISVKPEFANKIMEGSKTIELRKSAPKTEEGDLIVIYSTMPEKAVLGIGTVGEIIKSSPEEIWLNHSEQLGIDKLRFDQYYSGHSSAIGIAINNIRKYTEKVPLSLIKEKFPRFSPPQTFRYLNEDESLKNFLLA